MGWQLPTDKRLVGKGVALLGNMSIGYHNNLQQIIKQRRAMMGLTLGELGVRSGVSSSHLGRIERGERFPSARILRKIAKPLGLDEAELFTFAGYLPSQPNEVDSEKHVGSLDPYVADLLASESIATQRALVGILNILKSLANAKDGT